MPTFRHGDIVRVPFPYTDRDTTQRRPALVVSEGGLGPDGGLIWVVMITSANNRRWPEDVVIVDHTAAGLPAPSLVRPTKIATIEKRIAEPLGRMDPGEFLAVRHAVIRLLGDPAYPTPTSKP